MVDAIADAAPLLTLCVVFAVLLWSAMRWQGVTGWTRLRPRFSKTARERTSE